MPHVFAISGNDCFHWRLPFLPRHLKLLKCIFAFALHWSEKDHRIFKSNLLAYSYWFYVRKDRMVHSIAWKTGGAETDGLSDAIVPVSSTSSVLVSFRVLKLLSMGGSPGDVEVIASQ